MTVHKETSKTDHAEITETVTTASAEATVRVVRAETTVTIRSAGAMAKAVQERTTVITRSAGATAKAVSRGLMETVRRDPMVIVLRDLMATIRSAEATAKVVRRGPTEIVSRDLTEKAGAMAKAVLEGTTVTTARVEGHQAASLDSQQSVRLHARTKVSQE